MVEPTKARVAVAAHPAPLEPGTAAAVRRLAADAAAHDGVPPLSEQPLLWLEDPEAHVVHLLATAPEVGEDEPAGPEPVEHELVGYAQVEVGSGSTARAELVVHPAHRRTGVGTALLDAARVTAGKVKGRELRVWAHGDLPEARALAQSAGMAVVRELWQMRLDLAQRPQVPDRALPPRVTVREFVPGQDEEAWRRVNSRAFAHHPEQGRMTSADLRAREAEPWFDPAGFLLAERDGMLLGSVWTKVHPEGEHGDERVGEIYVVGVDPDAQGLGLGGALTDLGLTSLTVAGLRSVILYTEASNEVAIRTYRRAGFERSGVDVMFGDDTPRSPSGATMAP
ncbi:mycothiol synthase [Cellulomonas persica]|uniref:Mycothiol acetyltransferase n=1 Tax=Cellulomonas persica TaxID=76861 RepID=A0A510URY4_9CELL|nr:mycothiol synthase [Cellulomonas persica]GEK17418.1 mycothiol acetyltransferase [Cellulomonas persica]